MSSSSSTSPERPAKRGRGRGRGSSRGRGRSSSSGARGRRSASVPASLTSGPVADIVESRKDRAKAMIGDMPEQKVRELLLKAVEAQPSFILDLIEPVERQPGGYHPDSGISAPSWCHCSKCRQMPTERERVCCGKPPAACLTLTPDVRVMVLDEGVLELARRFRNDLFGFQEGPDRMKTNRHAAYRQFVLLQHGRLSAGHRVVIPSCCVWAIRDKYPDPYGQYTGFLPNRLP